MTSHTAHSLPTRAGFFAKTPRILRQHLAALLLSPALLVAAMAQAQTSGSDAVKVDTIAFEKKIQLEGTPLALNGAGLRTRFFVKVYAAALYLPTPAKTPKEIYDMKGHKRLHAVMLRDLDSDGFGKTMSQVMGDNLPKERFAKCVAGVLKLGEVFAAKKKMTVGEYYTVDDMPGKGTVISINGKVVSTIAEPEFFSCLMHNYFGEKPADSGLKTALLGQKP
jgi:hypothetical protein